MRPRFTLRKALLLSLALAVFGGLALWLSRGAPLPGAKVPSTAGKIAFISDKNGHTDLWIMNGADGSGAVALTNDAAEDRAPAWSRRGDEIAFVSDRRDGLQIFLVEPRPQASPRPLTITSASKDQPLWGGDGRVYYLASGQLTATTPGTSDADAILPTADQKAQLANLLATGGFSWAQPSPNVAGKAAVLRLEDGEALLMSPPATEDLVLAAMAQDITAAWLGDNTLTAILRSGSALPQPAVLLNEALLRNPQFALLALPPAPDMAGTFLTRFAADGSVLSSVLLPFVPTALALSPDGATAAVTVDEGKMVGVALVPVTGGTPRWLYKRAASDPVWSPDGKTLVFVADGDIWSVPADGTTAAKNLTAGRLGGCSSPTWSPARE